MCGVIALFRHGGGIGTADASAALEAIRHRGPDESGTYRSPRGQAVLAHTRLAMIDLAAGRQPIGIDNGDLQIVVAGEFYGHQAIAADLVRRGRTLRTRSDSELAAHLYAIDGPQALDRLRGEFALIIWDERKGELFAARDRFGIKPLYYAMADNTLLLASEIKALIAAGVPARWDLDAVADYLQIALPAGRTMFAGIRQLPAGCWLRAGAQGVQIERYWDLDFPSADAGTDPGGFPEQIERVRSCLTEAVQTRMVADVPVGYHLSGGLDSSSVVALAAQAGPPPVTFTVRFDDDDLDEGAIAGRTAGRLGAVNHEIPIRRSDIPVHLEATIRAGEIFQENSHGVARYLQSAAIHSHGFKAVQAGEGGDELFLGYPQARRDLELTCSESAWARAADGYAKLDPGSVSMTVRTLLAGMGLIPSWILERQMNVTGPIRPLLRDDFRRLLDRRDSAADLLTDAQAQLDGRAFVHQSQYLFIRTWMTNYILAAERLDMAHGLEVRLPLLDHYLFEAVRDTALDRYAPLGQNKYLLRAAMGSALPAEVLGAAKRPFFAPTADDTAFEALRALVDGPGLQNNPIVDPVKVRSALLALSRQSPARRARSERLLQIVAGICVLTDAYRMSAGEPS